MKRTELDLKDLVQVENSRSVYRDEDLQSLMASIKKDGLLHPIGVREISGEQFEIVYGNRRFMACQKLGWHSIPVSIISLKNDEDRDSLNLVENLHRADISTHDEGRIYYALQKQGLTTAEICARVGVTSKRVMEAITTFRNVPEEFRGKIKSTLQGGPSNKNRNAISASTASELVSITRDAGISKSETRDIFNMAIRDGMTLDTVRTAAKIIATGETIESALQKIKDFKPYTMSFTVLKSAVSKVERKYGRRYNSVIFSILASHKELGLVKQSQAHHLVTKVKKKTSEAYKD